MKRGRRWVRSGQDAGGTEGMETMIQVECTVCGRPFTATDYALAHRRMREHREHDHERWAKAAEERKRLEEMALTKWDKRFLDFCGIQFL
jgi:hypothetical protein